MPGGLVRLDDHKISPPYRDMMKNSMESLLIILSYSVKGSMAIGHV